jgi:hypothetical protein
MKIGETFKHKVSTGATLNGIEQAEIVTSTVTKIVEPDVYTIEFDTTITPREHHRIDRATKAWIDSVRID